MPNIGKDDHPKLWSLIFVLIIALTFCCFAMGQGLNSGTSVFLAGQGYGASLAGVLALVFSIAAALARLFIGPVIDNGKTPAQRLNSAVLSPKATLSAKEEKILLKYLDKIISDDMTNYEKAVACYDYIIKNTVYDYGGWANPVKAVLEDGYGTCTEYSYVYAAMLGYIGFDAKTVDGKTAMAAGGYGYHMWVEVTINGQVYVMDPQVDDNMSWGAYISHDRFCKTYSEVKDKYIKD